MYLASPRVGLNVALVPCSTYNMVVANMMVANGYFEHETNNSWLYEGGLRRSSGKTTQSLGNAMSTTCIAREVECQHSTSML